MMMFRLTVLLFVFVAGAAFGQDPRDAFLVPLAVDEPIPGAYDSLWETTLSALNVSATPVEVYPLFIRTQLPEYQVFVQPGQMRVLEPLLAIIAPPPTRGILLWTEEGRRDDLRFRLRIHDVSRQSLTWGTEIPVVHWKEAFSESIFLLDIPTDDRFRQMLRIYGFDPFVEGFVVDDEGSLLASRNVLLESPRQPDGGVIEDEQPTYAEIPWLTSEFPQIAGHERVVLEIAPLTADLRLWAFVSVTNNETQHVTLVTPD